MSDIPFSTVASILTTGSLQREAAAAIDRRSHDATRSAKAQEKLSREHAEEVEDPGAYALDAVHDQNQRGNQNQSKHPHKQPAEDAADTTADEPAHVDIQGVQSQLPPKPPPRSGIDISA